MFAAYTAMEYMKGPNKGVIVNVASMAGRYMYLYIIVNVSNLIGFCPIPGSESYSASKAGLIAFTRSMAQVLYYNMARKNSSKITPNFYYIF